MRLLIMLVAGWLALTWTADAMAASSSKKRYVRTYDASRYDSPSRSNTTAANGLCQRDTGTHNSNLSFRNKCDVEEFWARQQRGGRR